MSENKCYIYVKDVTGVQALSDEDGEKLFHIIENSISQKFKVIVDFEGVEEILTIYLNAAIAPLYENHTSDELNEYLKIINLGEHISSLKRVIQRAKIFYNNKNDMMKFMDKEVYDEQNY